MTDDKRKAERHFNWQALKEAVERIKPELIAASEATHNYGADDTADEICQGACANIPPKRNRKDPICFSPFLYRARNLVERFFNKIKHCRRVATRYDKLAANYLAFVKLAYIRLWLSVYEFTA
jgi:transposase